MVLKGTKRSLRTGNTLRNTRERQINSSFIVRHVTTSAKGRQHHTDEADDAHLTADSVEFSLNKKGRWKLPEVIEQNIEQSDTGSAQVSLLRRHRLNRQNDCLSIVASAGAGESSTACQRKKARRRTYCNGLNVLHDGRGKSTKEKKKKQVVSTKKDLAQQKQPHTEDAVLEKEEEDVRPTPEVRYDVFYSVPATSSLRYHPKFTATNNATFSSDLEQHLTATAKYKPGKGSYQRCKHVDYDFYGEEEDCYDDDWMYDEDENVGFHTQQGTEGGYGCDELAEAFTDRDSLFLYSDFVEQAFEVNLLCPAASADRKPRRKRNRKTKGGPFFYRPETENEFDSCLGDSQSDLSTESDSSLSSLSSVIKLAEIPSVVVELSRDATSSRRLAEQYGRRYSEAECAPRKIILDITDRVQAVVSDLAAFSDVYVPSLDLTTFLIFTYLRPVTQDSSGPGQPSAGQYDVFRVQLNMNCVAHGLTFSLQGKTTTLDSVEEVLEQVFTFMMALTPENIARHPCEASASALKSRLKPDFRTVAEVNGWKPSCVSLLDQQETRFTLPAASAPCSPPLHSLDAMDEEEDDEENDPCLPSDEDKSSAETQPSSPVRDQQLVGSGAHASSEKFCHICFSEILPGSLEGPHGTALTRCRHWFCDTCWQSHVSVALQEGSGGKRLQCPEFGCRAEVDPGTLLSLQHVRDVMLQQRRLVEVRVTRMFLCKWCPNPHCGRVVQLPTSSSSTIVAEPTSMSCPCGQRFCFRCHGDPHWPLSCEDLAQYQALLSKSGHLKDAMRPDQSSVVVRGKPCPSCHRFIEKNGGCPFMACVCGFQFWWCCRKPASKKHDCPLVLQGVKDTTNTVRKVIRASDSRPRSSQPSLSEWYEMAIRHRSLQHPTRVRHDCGRGERLRKRLQSLWAKGVDVGAPREASFPEENGSTAQTGAGYNPLASPRSAAGSAEEVKKSRRRADGRLPLCGTTVQAKGKARSRAPAVSKTDGVPATTTTTTTPTVATTTTATTTTTTSVPAVLERRRRHVKETTQAMIKLKVELHHVVENTAAFIHLRQDAPGRDSRGWATVRKVQDVVNRLEFLVSSLDGLLEAESGRDLTQVLPWFRSLQHNVKDTLVTLSALINKKSHSASLTDS